MYENLTFMAYCIILESRAKNSKRMRSSGLRESIYTNVSGGSRGEHEH